MKSQEYSTPDGFYYTRDHEWLKVEGDVCRIGVTDYAQKSLHEVVFVDLPKLGKVSRAESLGTVESVKAVSDYFAPVSGEVVEVNEALENRPDLINLSPYGDGWIAIIKPSALEAELVELMNSKVYSEFLRSLTAK
ncbi:glycine cleavage system protein GcvH [Candidatus Bathyarchaeota archaeon]|nr:glycine cleavage system protein GcvH [Candidatus Bathyarchaeota archaeon]